MNRKNFLHAGGLLAAGLALPKLPLALECEHSPNHIQPPFLKPGDTIGITSPAGYITVEEMMPAIQVMESWGFKIKIGDSIGKKDFAFGGTDEERAKDLQQMLDDKNIRAIMCARGGYGVVRIIDELNLTNFKRSPKWVIGFSDVTVLHNHIHRHTNVASIHSKMTNSFPDDWTKAEPIQVETISSIRDALIGKKMKYAAELSSENKLGTATGTLVGGNLRLIETLSGTPSDISTNGKILFVEDTGEYLYSIDRMFWHLKRRGKLNNLKGLIVGGFRIKRDEDEEPFGKTLQDIVLEKVKEYSYPVCFNFPVGHQRANFALKCGVAHKLHVQSDSVFLEEV